MEQISNNVLEQQIQEDETPREKVLRIARQLMLSQGIKNVKMDDVAKGVGMSKRTLYILFQDKTDLVRTMLLDNPKFQAYENLPKEGNAMQVLLREMQWGWQLRKSISPNFFDDLNRLYPAIASEYGMHVKQKHRVRLIELMEKGQQEKVFRGEINPESLTQMIVECSTWFTNNSSFPSEKFSLERLSRDFLNLFAYGIATDKGREFLEKTQIEVIETSKE